MAGSKREKKIKQKANPKGQHIAQGGDPEQYYSQTPAWTFSNADTEMWAFSQNHIGDLIWSEILPKLQGFETQTWSEILVTHKKQNHSLNLADLNKAAQERLASRYIEAESLILLQKSISDYLGNQSQSLTPAAVYFPFADMVLFSEFTDKPGNVSTRVKKQLYDLFLLV